MLELKKMCEEKVTSKSVEPNSPLWEPVTFLLNQWERLTLFCEAPGVPLDTNLVEQALIVPVRYLAGSFNYHTENGAVTPPVPEDEERAVHRVLLEHEPGDRRGAVDARPEVERVCITTIVAFGGTWIIAHRPRRGEPREARGPRRSR